MLSISVNINDAGASAGIAAIIHACQNRRELHEAMAASVENAAMEHLRELNSRSPNTSYYGRAARSSQVKADDAGAQVIFTHIGLALRYYGGRVLPKNSKNLAIPTAAVPLDGAEVRKRPRDMGLLAWLPAKKGAAPGTTGYFVEGMQKKGSKRIVPKPGGKLLYTLRSWTDHDEDPTVLPTIADLIRAATTTAQAFIESMP